MKYLLILALLIFSGCGGAERRFEKGRRAYRVGVSAEANPYKGTHNFANDWLDGWMYEAKEAEKQK